MKDARGDYIFGEKSRLALSIAKLKSQTSISSSFKSEIQGQYDLGHIGRVAENYLGDLTQSSQCGYNPFTDFIESGLNQWFCEKKITGREFVFISRIDTHSRIEKVSQLKTKNVTFLMSEDNISLNIAQTENVSIKAKKLLDFFEQLQEIDKKNPSKVILEVAVHS